MVKSLLDHQTILVVRPDGMGDLVLTIPFLRELRHNCPSAKITLLVHKEHQEFMERCPYIDTVLGITLKRHHRPSFFKILNYCRKHLWTHRWDAALYPRWDVDHYGGAFLSFLSGAKFRAGFSAASTTLKRNKNKYFDFFFNHIVHDIGQKHELDRNLFFLENLGGYIQNRNLEFWPNPEACQKAGKLLDHNKLKGKILAVGVGTSHPLKLWPTKNWVQLIKLYLQNNEVNQVILLGGSDVHGDGDAISKALSEAERGQLMNLVGQTSWLLSQALLEKCSFYVGTDSGLSHIAAALNKPALILFSWPVSADPEHPLAPERFKPRGGPLVKIVRPPSQSKPSAANVSIQQVWDSLQSLIS